MCVMENGTVHLMMMSFTNPSLEIKIPAFRTLLLHSNMIYFIQRLAFSGLVKLKVLSLSNNHLNEIKGHFLGMFQCIKIVAIQGMDFLVIDSWAFQDNC